MKLVKLFYLLSFVIVSEVAALELQEGVDSYHIAVENGTTDEVILDCPYILDDEDDKSGLVIKWYYNQSDYPVFQWIPDTEKDLKPQLTSMQDKIDVDYAKSDDVYHKHRALRLVSPTTEVHGLFTCEVSSYFDEKKIDVNLIVYKLPSALTIVVTEIDSENTTVECISEPAFPEPELELTLIVADTETPMEAMRETSWFMGLYNTTLTADVDMEELEDAPVVEFVCTLTIPHTDISVREGLKYRSDILDDDDDDDDEVTFKVPMAVQKGGATKNGVRNSSLVALALVALSALLM